MYYKLNKDVYFRNYGEFGYLTSVTKFNDKVVDPIGAIFLDALDQFPNSLELIADKIVIALEELGCSVEQETIESDAVDFFAPLVADGFLVAGETLESVEAATRGFTYDVFEPATMKKDFSPVTPRTDTESQSYLDDLLLQNPRLMSFQIELTSRCNERCVHCYIPHELKNDAITDDLYYSVLDQLEELGTWHLTLSGGEPMAHPHFKEFLCAAKERGFHVTVLSNLTLLDDETIAIMKDGNATAVQVSLYSMNPEAHDSITQLPGSFEVTVASIKKLIENDVPLQISCPVMKENKDGVENVLRFATECKVRAIVDYAIMAEFNHDTQNLSHRLSPGECSDIIKAIINYDKDYQKQIASPEFAEQAQTYVQNMDEQICGVGIATCCMTSNGNVYPCPGWQTCFCGNAKLEPLSKIWETSAKMQWLRSLRKSDLKACADCDARAFCSPCMVRNANESPTGDPFEINAHFCEVARVNRDVVMQWRKDALNCK